MGKIDHDVHCVITVISRLLGLVLETKWQFFYPPQIRLKETVFGFPWPRKTDDLTEDYNTKFIILIFSVKWYISNFGEKIINYVY